MQPILSAILAALITVCAFAADVEMVGSENFTIRKLMSAVQRTVNSEYNVHVEMGHNNYDIYNLSQETSKYGVSLGGWTVLDLWVFAFDADVESENKSIRDKWITWFDGGEWKFDRYKRDVSDKFINSDGNQDSRYNDKESWIKAAPTKEEVIKLVISVLKYNNLGSKLGVHSFGVQNAKYEDVFDEKTMEEIVGELNKEKVIFTLKSDEKTPFFDVTVSKINEHLMFIVVNRGLPLAGPIDGYWIQDNKVIRREGMGVK